MSVAKLLAERQRLEREREEIREQSTEHRLEKNRQALLDIHNRIADAQRAENARVSAVPVDPEYEQLRQSNINIASQIRGLEERATMGAGAFPEKYIRGDAVAHFRKQFEAAESSQSTLQDQINRIERQLNATAGGRLRQELAEAEMITGDWPKIEKLCRFGEQIFQLKQDIVRNQERMRELQSDRREKALATAG